MKNILIKKSENFSVKKLDWKKIQLDMKEKLGNDIYESWLKKIDFIDEFNNYILISVSTRFIRDWITSRYLDQILQIVKTHRKEISRIEFTINDQKKEVIDLENKIIKIQKNKNDNQNISFIKDSFFQYNRIDPNKNLENFIIGPSNKLAFEASKKVSEDLSHYNPLYLYGGVGMGKTHLLNAIGLNLKSKKKIMFISAERFMYHFVKSIKANEMVKFKDYFRNTDILLIDDIQFMNGKEAMQEEFFHTFNALVDQNRQIVVSADKSPSDLEGLEERLRSRLGWGLVADIHPTTYELRLSIIEAKLEKYNIDLPKDVAEFLAHKITTSVRELEGALTRLTAHVTLVGRQVDIEIAQDLLQDLLRASDRRTTIDQIQKKVAEHFNIKISDMHSARRSRTIARPRQIAMYLSKNLTTRSLPEIGRKFGGRDHTTVIHAIKKVEELKKNDSNFTEDVEILTRSLETQ